MQFSTELEYIYFELNKEACITDAEFYISGIILDLYKFKEIEPQLTMYCYESRTND